MARYGTDKPDLRFGMEMTGVSDLAAETEFRVFLSIVEKGGIVKGFVVQGPGWHVRRRLAGTGGFGARGRRWRHEPPPFPRPRHSRRPDRRGCSPIGRTAYARGVEHAPGPPHGRRAGRPGAAHGRPRKAGQPVAGRHAQPPGAIILAWPTQMPWPSPSSPAFPCSFGTRKPSAGIPPTTPSPPRCKARRACWTAATSRAIESQAYDLGVQRVRTGQRQHTNPSPGLAGKDIFGLGLRQRRNRQPVLPAARSLRVRGSSPRRHRSWHRPPRRHPLRLHVHQGRNRLPQDPKRSRPPLRRPRPRIPRPTARTLPTG